MLLSQKTLEILANFAKIQPNLLVKVGEEVSTLSDADSIMASAVIDEKFPITFGIYELGTFLSAIDLLGGKPELQFTEDSVLMTSGNQQISYRFADHSILKVPQKKINFPLVDVTVLVTNDVLKQAVKAASVLGHSVMSINGEDGKVSITLVNPKNPNADTWRLELDANNSQKATFEFQFLIANVNKALPGDYEINLSAKKISRWKHADVPVTYYIALEHTSSFIL